MELFQVVTLEEARQRIAAHWGLIQGATARLPLLAALDRQLANQVVAGEDVPGFTRSTVDGYAVHAVDVFSASEMQPVTMELLEAVATGTMANQAVARGQAAPVATGGMLPPGADAVVMLEYTEVWDRQLVVTRPVAPGENIILQGEDVARGQQVLAAGHRLRPQDLGVLASLGFTQVEVRLPVWVAVLSSGNEVVPVDLIPQPGQVRDINSYTLAGQVVAAGGAPFQYGILPDNEGQLLAAIKRAQHQSQLVLLSGGSSVGVKDVTLPVLRQLGKVLFHGISLRPGKPTVVVATEQGLIIGLPGHPVSAMVVFYLLIRPLLEQGTYAGWPPVRMVRRGRLTRNIPSGPGREDYCRVRLEQTAEGLQVWPVQGKSGLIYNTVITDGLVRVPLEQEGYQAGAEVEVMLW